MFNTRLIISPPIFLGKLMRLGRVEKYFDERLSSRGEFTRFRTPLRATFH